MKAALFVLMLAVGPVAGIAGGQTSQATTAGEHEHMASRSATPSTTLTVTVIGKVATLSLAELQAMPQTSLQVKNGHSGAMETYSGVAVGELLANYGFAFGGETAKQVYQSYVRAEGMDGYWVLYSASELEGALRETGAIVALTLDGKPLADAEGQFKIVVAGEKRPARWVRNLKSLTVVRVE